jgi:hypothetical protein
MTKVRNMRQRISGRGFLGLPQKGHIRQDRPPIDVPSEPSAIHPFALDDEIEGECRTSCASSHAGVAHIIDEKN